MTVSIESWREQRDQAIINNRLETGRTGGKHMDRYAGVPLDKIPEDEKEILSQVWMAYTLMISDRNREYIPLAAAKTLTSYAERRTDTSGLVIADLGCGNGYISRYLIDGLAQTGVPSDILMIDRSAIALRSALINLQQGNFSVVENGQSLALTRKTQNGSEQNLYFTQQDVTALDLPDSSLDAITAINVWHHLTTSQVIESANQIYRVLKPGGLFVIVDTAPLEGWWQQQVVSKVISKVVSLPRAVKRAKQNGLAVTDEYIKGAELFIYDAQKAFDQAFSVPQLEELLRESSLASSFTRQALLSPNPVLRLFYPALHFVSGVKPAIS